MSSSVENSGAADQPDPVSMPGSESESLEQLREAAAEYCAAGAEQARLLSELVENYIRQHPIKTLVGAAGAGFLLAWLMTRRK